MADIELLRLPNRFDYSWKMRPQAWMDHDSPDMDQSVRVDFEIQFALKRAVFVEQRHIGFSTFSRGD